MRNLSHVGLIYKRPTFTSFWAFRAFDKQIQHCLAKIKGLLGSLLACHASKPWLESVHYLLDEWLIYEHRAGIWAGTILHLNRWETGLESNNYNALGWKKHTLTLNACQLLLIKMILEHTTHIKFIDFRSSTVTCHHFPWAWLHFSVCSCQLKCGGFVFDRGRPSRTPATGEQTNNIVYCE